MPRHRRTNPDWPSFDAPQLQKLAAAFLKRRKAVAYQTDVSCTREFTESDTSAIERLNLDLCGRHLRLSIWADGVLWLGLCVKAPGRNAGWAFKDAFHGNARDVSAELVVGMVEGTLAAGLGANPIEDRLHLRKIWAQVRPG